ncbi:FkbM family methyltransferase [Thermogladius sp. 4427co]|uniref:FkbM family methyltransferase n=1 Tax=Thermogladius sp. 4427co TaxID=3450718 RepID=UPI003F7A1043
MYLVHNVKINKLEGKILCLNIGLSDKYVETYLENRRILFTRLDDLVKALSIDRVDIVKLDAEGRGASIIAGALETIKKFKPIVFFEVHNEEERRAIETLSKIGYEVYREVGEMHILIPGSRDGLAL